MSESSGNYRKLGRNGSGHHGLRSFSNFLLLLSAVFVFSLLYLYFSTSTELQSFRGDYEELNSRHLKLKNELLDVNLKLEQLKKDEADCVMAKDAVNGKYGTCQSELTKKASKLSELESHKTDCDGTIRELNGKLELAKKRLEEKMTATQKQDETAANLEKTIEQLKKQLELAQSGQLVLGTVAGQLAAQGLTTQSNAVAPLEMPKATTLKIDAAKAEGAAAKIEDGAHEKQSGAGDFIAPKRSPGGRVQLAEEAEKREKLSGHKELLKAAAKLDKQQEEEEEQMVDGKEEEGKDGKNEEGQKGKEGKKAMTTMPGVTEKNRPLVDALHGIVA